MGLRAHITEVRRSFMTSLPMLARLPSCRGELEGLIKRIDTGEILCPDFGNKDDPGFASGSSLLVWLKKLVVSSPHSSCVTIDWL